jgi:hypothetical protein
VEVVEVAASVVSGEEVLAAADPAENGNSIRKLVNSTI